MNLLRTITALLLLPAAAFAQDSFTLLAPAPPPPNYIGASYSGQPGPASYYYWVSAVYPGGESGVAGPAAVRGAANTLSGSNTVSVSWSAAFGATAYNVIRTLTPVFSTNCSDCLLASGVTATTTADTGAALSAYAGAGAAAPATGGLTINVRDYAAPRLELRLNGAVAATVSRSGTVDASGFTINGDPLSSSSPTLTALLPAVTVFGPTTANSTGNGKVYIPIPENLDTYVLTGVSGHVISVGTTGTLQVQLTRCAVAASGNQCASTASMLSTVLSIDSGEANSSTAATAAVINTSNDDVATGQLIRIDIPAVHSTPAEGLVLSLEFSPAP